MSDDIVKRLRNRDDMRIAIYPDIMAEAADEIERLRRELVLDITPDDEFAKRLPIDLGDGTSIRRVKPCHNPDVPWARDGAPLYVEAPDE